MSLPQYYHHHHQGYSKGLSGDSQLVVHNTLRSTDATTCDFYLRGQVKGQVHAPPLPASIPELKV